MKYIVDSAWIVWAVLIICITTCVMHRDHLKYKYPKVTSSQVNKELSENSE